MATHHEVQLRRKGKLVRMEWNNDIEKFEEYEIPTDELAFHLHSSICFAEDVTLRDLFDLIDLDQDLFTTLTACDCLPEIISEAEQENRSEDIVALEMGWSFETETIGDMTLVVGGTELYGLGSKIDDNQTALEFMSMDKIAGLPLLLNETFNIRDGLDPEKVIFSSSKRFTLLSVICGVIEEVTFLGSPSERNEALSDVRNCIAEANDDEFHTMDDIKNEMNKREEEGRKRFPCRLCLSDSRCPCFGKPSDICHDCFRKIREN